ncbi:cytidylyltransferase domain-containing protein [Alkalibacillus haloalkaliphilus]|uniref:3-deoxy-manno-octulosonate cytidylyltransferase n=1 Tax=Alkalibacillus haloalkaliphilus TaxID=94136 RepID=A0A511W427_9BACI|nr:glycosyltransferase family protein [Alkalibacillus haloalkaliphilus]GEN45511.1 3-deoxy-manno-octulosonate cytidylyltransferase [Alkalibacillus haloalkaliphilus]
MKIVAIIQARMGSTRLPGKVLKPILSKPLLAYQIDQLKHSKLIDQLVIATTTASRDDAIVDFCKSQGITYYRGSETDVLKRYEETAKTFNANVVVRLTSDCPLIDSTVVDSVIGHFLTNRAYDYVSNTIKRTFPRGMDTEVFTYELLKEADQNATLKREREHVTTYMTNPENKYNMGQYLAEQDYSDLRLTVDTIEDFQLVERVIKAMRRQNGPFKLTDIIQLLQAHPDWKLINSHIEQKKD